MEQIIHIRARTWSRRLRRFWRSGIGVDKVPLEARKAHTPIQSMVFVCVYKATWRSWLGTPYIIVSAIHIVNEQSHNNANNNDYFNVFVTISDRSRDHGLGRNLIIWIHKRSVRCSCRQLKLMFCEAVLWCSAAKPSLLNTTQRFIYADKRHPCACAYPEHGCNIESSIHITE